MTVRSWFLYSGLGLGVLYGFYRSKYLVISDEKENKQKMEKELHAKISEAQRLYQLKQLESFSFIK